MAEKIFNDDQMINGTYEGDSIHQKAEEYDSCISCGELTKYKKIDHVDNRYGYVDGAGQLCSKCNQNFNGVNINYGKKEISVQS